MRSKLPHELYVLFALTLASLFPVDAAACGSESKTFGDIYALAETRDEMTKQLGIFSGCGLETHASSEADSIIFRTLLKAQDLGVNSDLITKVFVNYRCLYSARHRKEYDWFRKQVGLDAYDEVCHTAKWQNTFVVTPKAGATLRKGPSTTTERIYGLAQHQLVQGIGESGDWQQVKWHHHTGFIRSDLLTRY